MFSNKEMTFLLYALRAQAFENDLQGVQEQAEAIRKKIVEWVNQEIKREKSQEGSVEAVNGRKGI